MANAASSSQSGRFVAIRLMPIMAAVLAGFLIIGLALPVLPLHIENDLGFGTVVVGLVAGAQFAASLVSRVWAGSFSDKHGAKRGVIVGLIAAAISGLLYLLSLAFVSVPVISVAILLIGRGLLGGAESFIITGGVSWGLALVDKNHAGKVIAWVGTAMFAALAFGGPIGTVLFTSSGFAAIALVTMLLPITVLLVLLRMPAVEPHPYRAHSALKTVMGSVWMPGLGAALSSIGYCSILAFSSLLFAEQHWQPIWLPFTAFGAALIVSRMIAGHLPDKYGGAKVALIFVLVQSAGLVFMSLASSALIAAAGAALAGFGYSLVYPGLGVEAVRGTSPENRGLTMGIYTAFLDLAMAVGSPALGWVAGERGLSSVFIASAIVVLCAGGIAIKLLYRRSVA
ncbi:arabinose transporter [Azospirillum palustre]